MYLFTREGNNAEHRSSGRIRLPLIAFGTITILSALFLNSIQPGYSISIDDFVGTWENPSTGTVMKVTVDKYDSTTGDAWLNIIGVCYPVYYGDCDWGTKSVSLEGDQIGGTFYQFQDGGSYLIRYVYLTLNPDQTLSAEVKTESPGPAPPDEVTTETLTKTDNFSISINPPSAAITAGDTAESTITLKLEGGDGLSVPLSCSMDVAPFPGICNIDRPTIDLSPSSAPTETAKLVITTQPETQPNRYTVYVTGDEGGYIQRTATFELDVKASAGLLDDGGLSPTMLAIIIGGAVAAVGGGAFMVLKKRARKADPSIP